MGIQQDHLKVIERAMEGHEDSLSQLAEIVHAPLRTYVLRIAFDENIVDDIVQETLLEMFKIFRQLKKAEQFWPWLCKIALNKIRIHSRSQTRHRQLLKENSEKLSTAPSEMDGLATAINEEFKQCILKAMSVLNDRQKAVLSMRCYEDMSYSQIAEVLGISELGCRLLFVRARKKLQKNLVGLGYGQKSLLFALVVFGKLTASSEAAAAQVCIAPAALSAGAVAGGIALLTSKTMLTVTAGIAVAAGVAFIKSTPPEFPEKIPVMSNTIPMVSQNELQKDSTHINEGGYLFPQGKQGAVLSRLTVHEPGDRVIQILQNDTGNYTYDVQKHNVVMSNYHYWKPDLSVMTLPTDDKTLESFLAQMENRPAQARTINADSTNLYIVASGDEGQYKASFGIKNYDALLEERFQYSWPAGIDVIDDRDDLHRLGWCYFKFQGQIRGKAISGTGRFPFVYAQSRQNPAWIKMNIDDKMTLIDTFDAAYILDSSGKCLSRYPGGTFMNGLNKPWLGFHVIDTVRRDAARYRILSEAHIDSNAQAARIRLYNSGGDLIEYLIDMKKDLIRQIRFFDTFGQPNDTIIFDYLGPDDIKQNEFMLNNLPLNTSNKTAEPIHWLSELGAGILFSDPE